MPRPVAASVSPNTPPAAGAEIALGQRSEIALGQRSEPVPGAQVAAFARRSLSRVSHITESDNWSCEDTWGCEDRRANWTACRRYCDAALKSHFGQASFITLTIMSFILIVVETDRLVEDETGSRLPAWIPIANTCVLAAFVAELIIRLYVWRWEFFRSRFNILDFTIVFMDFCSEVLSFAKVEAVPSLTAFRIFRLARLVRGVRVMVHFPQLSIMVKGLMSAVHTIFWGLCFLVVVLLVWGVLAVQILHPLNQDLARSTSIYSGCDRCPHAFESVGQSVLTFTQQIVAGDGWGVVTVPIIEEWPLSILFFGVVFISVNLALLNLILAVIVDSALKASEADVHEVLRQKANDYNAVKHKLLEFCRSMDVDKSGDLTLHEFMRGYDTNQEFADLFKAMDILKEDLHMVHSMMDKDSSGGVNYDEFLEEVFKMKTHDTQTTLIFIKFYVTDIRNKMQEQFQALRSDLISKIEERTGSPVSTVHPGTRAGSRPAEKEPNPPLPVEKAEPARDLGEELRRLRTVIGEDLVRSMREVALKSEHHTRLLASIVEGTPHRLTAGIGSSTRLPELWPPAVSKAAGFCRESAAGGGHEPGTSAAGGIDGPGRAPASSWGLRGCYDLQAPPARQRTLEPAGAPRLPPDNSSRRPGGT